MQLDPRDTDLHEQLATNYRCQRRYTDAARVLDAALAIVPGSVSLREFRGRLDLAIVGQDPSRAGAVAYGLMECSLCQRDPAAVEHTLSLGISGRRAVLRGESATRLV